MRCSAKYSVQSQRGLSNLELKTFQPYSKWILFQMASYIGVLLLCWGPSPPKVVAYKGESHKSSYMCAESAAGRLIRGQSYRG